MGKPPEVEEVMGVLASSLDEATEVTGETPGDVNVWMLLLLWLVEGEGFCMFLWLFLGQKLKKKHVTWFYEAFFWMMVMVWWFHEFSWITGVVVSNMFLMFIPIWGRFPFWLICFKWVGSTTDQILMDYDELCVCPSWGMMNEWSEYSRSPTDDI